MAIYKVTITAADSKIGTGPQVIGNEASASYFTLDQGAFLISTDDDAIVLTGAGAWTATINGQAIGQNAGLFLQGGGAAAKITIGEDGSLYRSSAHVALFAERDVSVTNKGSIYSALGGGLELRGGGTNSVTNNGMIIGRNGSAIKFINSSNDTVTNTGTMLGSINFADGTNKLVNSGLITNITASPEFAGFGATTSNVIFGGGDDIFYNKGTINGSVDLGGGSNTAVNSKYIGGGGFATSVTGGGGADTFTNAKGAMLEGGVDLGIGKNSFTNTGTVGNDIEGYSYFGGVDIDSVQNSGRLEGGVYLGAGSNSFTNSGTVGKELGGRSYEGGASVDIVKNSGVIESAVYLGGGNDVLTNSGQVLGFIDLGAGNDVFKGGKFAEVVIDGEGSDKISLGGGDDTFTAYGGAGDGGDGLNGHLSPDEVDGGTGIDTYDGSAALGLILLNLDSVDHGGASKGIAEVNTGSVFIDKLKGFENVTGGNFVDIIYGSASANVIRGGESADGLHGLAGNDSIYGDGGDDYIYGGIGADVLTGGSGSEYFIYETVKDSGLTKATRDEILDFEDGIDRISLFDIDAIAGTDVDDAFSGTLLLGNGTFSIGQAGVLRIYQTATGWMVEGDVNGDAKADFSIAVRDADHSISWGSDNFFL